MDTKKRLIPLTVVVLAAVGIAWWLTHRHPATRGIVLYGNVDLREVDLAFNDSQRVASVLVREGDSVRKGQVLARLDTSRLEPRLAQARAQAAAQHAAVDRLHHGTRPQEIAQARANLALAQADARQANDNYQRLEAVSASYSFGRLFADQPDVTVPDTQVALLHFRSGASATITTSCAGRLPLRLGKNM